MKAHTFMAAPVFYQYRSVSRCLKLMCQLFLLMMDYLQNHVALRLFFWTAGEAAYAYLSFLKGNEGLNKEGFSSHIHGKMVYNRVQESRNLTYMTGLVR